MAPLTFRNLRTPARFVEARRGGCRNEDAGRRAPGPVAAAPVDAADGRLAGHGLWPPD